MSLFRPGRRHASFGLAGLFWHTDAMLKAACIVLARTAYGLLGVAVCLATVAVAGLAGGLLIGACVLLWPVAWVLDGGARLLRLVTSKLALV